MPLFPWDDACAHMPEHPLVPSMKLLETARSPRCQEALENWEQTHAKCLCSHGTTHTHMHMSPLLFPPGSCWIWLDLQDPNSHHKAGNKDMKTASVPMEQH